MTNLPNLHDGWFDGVWLSGTKHACLFLRTVNGDRSTIVLADVEALNIRDLKQGNIILDVMLIGPDALTLECVNEAYDLKHEPREMSLQLDKARRLGLSALEINTSYGAQGTVLFRTAKLISGHVVESPTL